MKNLLVNFAEIQSILLKDIKITTNILTLLCFLKAVCSCSVVPIEYLMAYFSAGESTSCREMPFMNRFRTSVRTA